MDLVDWIYWGESKTSAYVFHSFSVKFWLGTIENKLHLLYVCIVILENRKLNFNI